MKPVYEIDLEIGNLQLTLLTLDKPKYWLNGGWQDSDVEPVGYLKEANNEGI